jgi:hypothetical protein
MGSSKKVPLAAAAAGIMEVVDHQVMVWGLDLRVAQVDQTI